MSKVSQIKISPESLAEHMASLRTSPAFQILLQYAAEERENILEEGKASRRDEKNVKMWAVLEGFDRFSKLPEKLYTWGKNNSGVEDAEIPLEL